MAGVIGKSLLSVAKRIVSPSSAQILKSKFPMSPSGGMVTLNAPRNLWHLSCSSWDVTTISSRLVPASHTCGCRCQLHTEVDGAISKFLDKEIKLEETSKSNQKLPTVKGFELSKSDGSDVELVKQSGNEKVTVKFNVNASVDSDHPPAVEGQSEEATDMVSRPSFTVELNKGDNQILAVHCYFPEDGMVDDASQEGTESIEDLFEIQEVALYSGEWSDSVYSLQAETMDGNLYDLIMDMLDERGINDEFVNDLIEFSTVYEHGKYIGFLKNMKSFVDKN
ncbi:complement component 1 Q subcomponent-binding protein, mitochondrial [Patella vulgata]|uniref:complement component 1 Q subcomponent-binding protein, mitochondrial n=1 Tax=Patella vulgata TaxID=6465 RepID=UPI00217F86B8|nr:complement component 1 Q subcomponent-binding protein, mitochondrial [Patella vulgata]